MKVRDLIALHGRAWCAVNDWASAVMGEEWMEAHDDLFCNGEWYPASVIRAAQLRLRKLYALRKP